MNGTVPGPTPRRQKSVWPTVYWVVQILSGFGFIAGFGWIVMAFMSQHQGNDADHVSVIGGLAWEIGVVPVMVATGFMTLVLMLLGRQAFGTKGVFLALGLQAAFALCLYVVLTLTAQTGLWY